MRASGCADLTAMGIESFFVCNLLRAELVSDHTRRLMAFPTFGPSLVVLLSESRIGRSIHRHCFFSLVGWFLLIRRFAYAHAGGKNSHAHSIRLLFGQDRALKTVAGKKRKDHATLGPRSDTTRMETSP